MKLISVVALFGLLTACSLGATTPSEQALPTVGGGSTGTLATPSASTATAMSCDDAFASVDFSSISSASDLSSLSTELDQTIASCQSLDEWTAAIQKAAPDIGITDALAFVQTRCQDNPALATSQICFLVGS